MDCRQTTLWNTSRACTLCTHSASLLLLIPPLHLQLNNLLNKVTIVIPDPDPIFAVDADELTTLVPEWGGIGLIGLGFQVWASVTNINLSRINIGNIQVRALEHEGLVRTFFGVTSRCRLNVHKNLDSLPSSLLSSLLHNSLITVSPQITPSSKSTSPLRTSDSRPTSTGRTGSASATSEGTALTSTL